VSAAVLVLGVAALTVWAVAVVPRPATLAPSRPKRPAHL
jgi:hypothetical protein